MDRHEHRLKALGTFLKSRHSRLTPRATGLPDGHYKRRTSGLKREEVALLAGVSTTWYTWLEQGRDINVSEQVLQSIARALQLNDDEYSHMLYLARLQSPAPAPGNPVNLPPSLQKIIDDLSHPGMIVNVRSDVLAWNSASCEYFVDFSTLPRHERNMTWQMFANESLRDKIANWEECAAYAVAVFRAFSDRNAGNPWIMPFVDGLMRASPYFKDYWNRYEIREKSGLIINFKGRSPLEVTSLQLNNGTGDLHCFICTPV
ncbi:helix-turn-helix transcriptional regulator [Paenibacillus allorhizosphaerae]|uniref:HTH cro/C1-type domain-containing protein n=1 Tax=Paenibacillus allorhizosphaerae TaxID=2849866 RepID=A0ABM8VQC6_9BACL|nr:helix-turn-helix transcriptional regulator [Paenibacillus allorhizosphaerae]CAG7653992.1 hypothetical protein PAECIP111802_05644 [Paenibacillus allorhizosphaerae]